MENAHLLERARLGTLICNRSNGSAIGVPVWFDWDGVVVRCFAASDSGKIRRITRDPRVSLLISNDVGEPEAWLAFDGEMKVHADGGFELAERLASRYWDLADSTQAARLDAWRAYPEAFVLLVLKPDHIRSGH